MFKHYYQSRLRRLAFILTALLIAVTGAFTFAAPASAADVYSCDYSWGSLSWQSASWGRAKYCEIDGQSGDGITDGGVMFQVQTEDILTDGYCVHVEAKWSGTWHYVSNSQSCGEVRTSAYIDYAPDNGVTAIRLIRGTGGDGIGVNYKTLYDQL